VKRVLNRNSRKVIELFFPQRTTDEVFTVMAVNVGFFVEAEEGATLKWEVIKVISKRRTRGNGVCDLNRDDNLLFLDSDGCQDADLFDEAGVAKNGLISESFCGKYKKPKRFIAKPFGFDKERVCIFFSAKAKALGENPNAKQGKGWQMVVTAE